MIDIVDIIEKPSRPRTVVDDLRDWVDRATTLQEAWNSFWAEVDIQMLTDELEVMLTDELRLIVPSTAVTVVVGQDADRMHGSMGISVCVSVEFRPSIDDAQRQVIDDALKERASVLADMGESYLNNDTDDSGHEFSTITWMVTVEVGD